MQIRLTSRLVTPQDQSILRDSESLEERQYATNSEQSDIKYIEKGKNPEKLKITVAQLKTRATRISENTDKIIVAILEADKNGSDLVTFPELTITGYLSHDLFKNPRYIRENIVALEHIIEATKNTKITAIIGFVDGEYDSETSPKKMRCYDSAAVISGGKLIDVIDKSLLPEYDIFWEPLYFQPASRRHIVEINGHKIGIQICEDLWDASYETKVTDELVALGAEIIINLSASPFQSGKFNLRYDLIRQASSKHHIPFIYTNLVGSQDGYEGEVVFDGRSIVSDENGELIGIGKSFQEDLFTIDLNKPEKIQLPTWTSSEEIYDAIVLGIREFHQRCGRTRAYIGLSGGIDSAVTAALAVQALGKENVIGVTMPSHITSSETLNDAIQLAANLGIRCEVRPIEEQYRAWEKGALLAHKGKIDPITKQNVQARIRGQILMEYANQDSLSLVIVTGNKTEMALGYMTQYGDMCGALAPLGDVSKQAGVYDLARIHNLRANKEEIPLTTIERVPSAELEKDQSDRDNLPDDYPTLSPLVEKIIEEQANPKRLYRSYEKTVVDRTFRSIGIAEFKRRQSAPAIKVTPKAFGAGRRFPIDNKFI